MKGLLKRAEKIRTAKKDSSGGDSIISRDEQQEILKEIDRISGQSRINVTPDLFKLNALKNGILFPLLVNIVAFAILGGGLYATKYYFEIKDKENILESFEQQSAEGNLIKEIRKETDKKLADKENEIQGIQASMEKVESERLALQQDMNNKINERELQLKQELEITLALEREKLLSEGVSTGEIDRQIAALKLEQSSIFELELENYREEAELEKIELESSLNQLHDEYNSKLVTVNEERAKIESEARRRETELTEKMESRTRVLETEKTEAQLAIQKLTKTQEQESLVENQIIGFYKSIEDLIKEGELDAASNEIKNLENYLYDDSVVNLEGINKRREIDLFVIDSLLKLIESAKLEPQEELDAMSLIDAADRLKDIQQIVKNADQQLAVGNDEMADIMYRNALESIPEIKRSHHYFFDAMESELELGYEQLADIQSRFDRLQQENQERQNNVSNLLAAADRTYNSGTYNEALDAYKQAFAATGFDDMDKAAENMIQSGTTLAIAPFKEKIGGMTEELTSLKLEKENYLIEKQAIENEIFSKDEKISSFSEKLEISESEVAFLGDQLESEKTQVIVLRDQIGSYEQRIEEMKLNLEAERNKVTTSVEEGLLINEDIAELTTLKSQLNRINRSYTDFELKAGSLDDNIQGDAETIEALYSFLEEDSIEDVFPGISEYLRSFSNVYINAGTEIGLYEAVSLLYDLNSLSTNSDKRKLLKSKRELYENNDAVIEMINQIEKTYRREE